MIRQLSKADAIAELAKRGDEVAEAMLDHVEKDLVTVGMDEDGVLHFCITAAGEGAARQIVSRIARETGESN